MDQIYYLFSKHYHAILQKAMDENNPNVIDMLNKKFIHTFRVINNTQTICHKENLDTYIMQLSEICALFHDIARFDQALYYGHFNDLESFDHAESSANILIKHTQHLLNLIKEEDIKKIEKAIRYHNKIEIPPNENKDVLLLTKILKDADKINILSINLKSNFIQFDGRLTTDEIINENCIEEFLNKRVVKSKDVTSILDNNIKMLSWIYDLHFKTSLEMYQKEKFIDILTDTSNIKSSDIKNKLLDLKEISTNYIEYMTNQKM